MSGQQFLHSRTFSLNKKKIISRHHDTVNVEDIRILTQKKNEKRCGTRHTLCWEKKLKIFP